MNWRVLSFHRVARFALTLLLAAPASLGSVAAANAQPLKPDGSDGPTPVLVPIGPTVPRKPPAKGVSLDEARAAAQALAGPQQGAAVEQAATLAGGGIVAVFIAPVQVLAVIGNAQDNTITVSRDTAGKLLVLIGGPSQDVLNGGPGDNILIQD